MYSFTMDTNMYVEKIRDMIDQHHLGINKETCFRPFIGAYLSFFKSNNLSKEKITDEMQKIESYFPKNISNNKEIFKKLIEKHWYVYYLLFELVTQKLGDFRSVNGSTLDNLYAPNFTQDINGVQEMIHEQTYTIIKSELTKEINITPLTQLNFCSNKTYRAIHFAGLYTYDKPINRSFLTMSTNGKYLAFNDTHNDIIIWKMKTGNKVEVSEITHNNLQWSQTSLNEKVCEPFIINQTGSYGATVSTMLDIKIESYINANGAVVNFDKNKSVIILYKKPTEISCLCQQAFQKSKHNLEELISLKNSSSIKKIKGFPRKNLELLIEKQITWLSPNQIDKDI